MQRQMPVSRRTVLSGIGAGLACHSLPASSKSPAKLPNILWLVSEDNNPFIGAYGDKLAHTPNLDALAGRGILYRNVYCTVPVCSPSRFSILTGIDAQSCAPAQHHTANAHLPIAFRTYPEIMREAGYYCTNMFKTDYNCDVDPKIIWDVQGPEGHWRSSPREQPFLCVINTGSTHESQICMPVEGSVSPNQIRVPDYLPDTPGVRQDFATYYNLMEKMDTEVGNHLEDLKRANLADDTIVFYYSDNGGVLPRSKRFCYEEGQRIAMIVSVPPKWQHLVDKRPGSEESEMVSLLDLAPTLLAIAGIRQPPQMLGRALMGAVRPSAPLYIYGSRDRMDERYDFIRTVTDGRFRYIRNYMPHRPWGQHVAFQSQTIQGYRDWEAEFRAGQLTPVQARFFQEKPFEELYDLSADPDEIVNLAASSDHSEIIARLSRALDDHMIAINDNGFLAEGMDGEGFFESRDRNRYPLKAVMSIAAKAAQRDARQLPRFQALLSSTTPVIRLWAAQAILMMGSDGRQALADVSKVMRIDPVPQVRVVAAEAAAKQGSSEAIQVLAGLSGTQNSKSVRLQALNALTYVGPAAASALPTIKSAANESGLFNPIATCARYLVAIIEGSYDPLKQGLNQKECEGQKLGARKFMG